jgi:hypothetical protein
VSLPGEEACIDGEDHLRNVHYSRDNADNEHVRV